MPVPSVDGTLKIMALIAIPEAGRVKEENFYIQIATLQIEPPRLAEYHAAVTAQAKAAIENEPGVVTLNAVADKDDQTLITVFEIYEDRAAYESHLKAEHFLKYKATVESMVKSLTLTPVRPVVLATKPQP